MMHTRFGYLLKTKERLKLLKNQSQEKEKNELDLSPEFEVLSKGVDLKISLETYKALHNLSNKSKIDH
jgi:hypothetical protein